jgi:hypothetical protein
MEKKFYAKLFVICLWVLLALSVGLLCYAAFIGKFSEGSVNALLYWAYGMLGLAIAAIVVVGLYITATTNPKRLLTIVYVVVGAAALCGLAWLLAKGAPAQGYTGAELPTQKTLKLTDTVLNLTYILGGTAILSIIVGEIVMALRGKKA